MAASSRSPSKLTSKTNSRSLAPATERDVRVSVFRGAEDIVWNVAMPDDGRFAVTLEGGHKVRRWELSGKTGKDEVVLSSAVELTCLAITRDGKQIAVADLEARIRVGMLTNFQKWDILHVGSLPVIGLAFIKKTGDLLSGSADGCLTRWNLCKGTSKMEFAISPRSLSGVAASLDGERVVASIGEKDLVLWKAGSKTLPSKLVEDVSWAGPVSITENGKFAFTGTRDGKVTKWNLDDCQRVASYEGHSGQVDAVAATLDGRLVASGARDSAVRLWDARIGRCLALLRGHDGEIYDITITPDGRRIASASADGTLRVWDIPDNILARANDTTKRGYMNAKIVLLGESGVGKSGLAKRLWYGTWEKTDSTHGMEIQRLVLPDQGTEPEVTREVWLWDLAGQPDYRLTHQVFMEQTALALLVFDPQARDVLDTMAYWQGALRKVARNGEVPGILVAARCDRPGLRLTMEEIAAWAKSRGLKGPILTAAKLKKHPGARELLALIAELLPWDQMEFRSTMENFPPLKDAILAARDAKGAGGVVVDLTQLETRVCKAAPHIDFTTEDLRAVTGLLAGEGVLYALPYGGLIVLQPSWLNGYASTVVKLAGEAKNQMGHVPMQKLQPDALPLEKDERLAKEDEEQLLPAVIELFLRRGLAWRQDTDRGAMLVLPYYARVPRPEPPPRPGRSVVYRFTGPLEEIYCTLVVRLHYSKLFDAEETKLWRLAVDFHTMTGELVALTMQEQGDRGTLELYFGPHLPPLVQATVQQFVDEHLRDKASELERLRSYFCPKCHEEVTDRRAIDAAKQRKQKKLVCQYCDPDDKPGVIDLDDVLEKQFARKEGEKEASAIRREVHDAISTAAMEQQMVGEVMVIVASANQIWVPREVCDVGIDGAIEFRERKGKPTGLAYRVQLKSGKSHLRERADGSEVFDLEGRHEELWARATGEEVLLIVRDERGTLRFINATHVILAARKSNRGKAVKHIDFDGQPFDKAAVLRLRDERLRRT